MSSIIFIFAFFASIVLCMGTAIRTPEFEKSRFIPIVACLICMGMFAAIGFQWFDLETPFIQMAVIAIVANMLTIALKAVHNVTETTTPSSYEDALVVKPEQASVITPERKKPVVVIDKSLLTETVAAQGGTRLVPEKTLVEA